MPSLPTVDTLPASTTILDDTDTKFINYTAPFSNEPNLTCRGQTCTEILGASGSLQFSFQGTDVWLFGKPPGIARIFLNGVLVEVLDTTANTNASMALWGANNLDAKATNVLKIGGVDGEGLNVLVDFFAVKGTVIPLSSAEASTASTGYDPTPAERRKLTGILVGTLFGFFAFLLLIGGGIFLYIRRQKQKAASRGPNEKTGAMGTPRSGVLDSVSSFFSGLSKKSKLRGKHGTLPLIKLIRPRQSDYGENNASNGDAQSRRWFNRSSNLGRSLGSPGSGNDPFRSGPYMIPIPEAERHPYGMNANGYNGATGYPDDAVSPPPPNQPLVPQNVTYEPPSPPYAETISSDRPQPGPSKYTQAEGTQWHPYTLASAAVAVEPANLRTGGAFRVSQDEETTPLMETPPDYPFQGSNRAPPADQKARPSVSSNESNGGQGTSGNVPPTRTPNGDGPRGQDVSFITSTLGISPSTPTPAYSSWSHSHPYAQSPQNNLLVPPFSGGSESTFGPSRPFDSYQFSNSPRRTQAQIPSNQRPTANGRTGGGGGGGMI